MGRIKSFLLENKTVRQTFFKNTFWLTFGNVVSKAIHAVLIIAAARILQTAGYGVFAYALSFAAFFTIFSDIGLSGLLTREMAKDHEKKESYLATTFYLKILLVLVSVLVTAFIGPFFTKIQEVKTIIPIIAILMAFDSMRGFFFSITRSYNKMEIEGVFNILTEIFITGLSLTILFIHPSPEALTITYTVGSGIGFLAIAFKTRKIWVPAVLHFFDRKLIRQILSAAWPFAVMGLLGTFMINIDSVILGWFRSASELGLYAAAQKPIQLIYIIPSLASTSFFPLISAMVHKGEKVHVENLTRKLTTGVLAIGLPMAVGGIILSHRLINLFFGASYLPATLTLQLLFVTLPPVFVGLVFGNVIFAYNQQKIFVRTTLIGAILNTGLDFLLIPPYGIWGSAIATIIADVASNGYTWYKVNQIVKVKMFSNAGKVAAATILMGVIAFGLNRMGLNVLLTVLVAAVSYTIALIALKEPALESIPIVNRLVK